MRRFIISLSSFSILVIAACSQEETQGDAKLASSVTVGASHISAISAVLAGKANLGSTVATDLKVGFQYSKSAGILPSNSTTVEASDADADYNYTTSITWLDPATTYYYRSFVRQNGQDTYGETKEFTRPHCAREPKHTALVRAAIACSSSANGIWLQATRVLMV